MSDDATHLRDLVGELRTVMMTTGDLHGRPLSVQRIDDDATTWILVDPRAPWMEGDLGRVNLTWVDDDRWVAAVGVATCVDDRAVIDDLRDPIADSFFEDGASPVALRIAVDHADWWTAPGTVARGVRLLLGVVRGQQGDIGDRGVIEA